MSNLLENQRPAALVDNGLANHGLSGDVLELHVTTPGLPPKIARVADRTISLGAGPRCTVQLSAPGLRPMHCLITRTDTGLSVRRWANNTLLNGRSFSEAPLTHGDRLSIGDCFVEIHTAASFDQTSPLSIPFPTDEVSAKPAVEQDDEPITTVDEAVEMIAADLALDETAVPAAFAEEPIAVEPEQLAPALELAGPPVAPFTPSPLEAVAANPRALMTVPAHLLQPWQAVQGDAESFAAEVAVAAPEGEKFAVPLAGEQSLTPVLESPVAALLASAALSQPAAGSDAETKDFVPLAAATFTPHIERLAIDELVPVVEPAPVAELESIATVEPTIERLRDRLAWNRQRVGRLAALVRAERGVNAAQATELSELRDALVAVTAERDELRLSSQQFTEIQQELIALQTELEALELQSEELRATPATEPAAALAAEALPECAPLIAASDPWAEFALDSTPEPAPEVPVACEPEPTPQLTASFAGWKTDPEANAAFATLTPTPTRPEVFPPVTAGLWEVESESSGSPVLENSALVVNSALVEEPAPAHLWGVAEEPTFDDSDEFAACSSESSADDSLPDPFAEEAAETWSLTDALLTVDQPREGDAPRSTSNVLQTTAPASETLPPEPEFAQWSAPLEIAEAAEFNSLPDEAPLTDPYETRAELVSTAEPVASLLEAAEGVADEAALEVKATSQPLLAEEEPPASEPKPMSALFTPPPAAPTPAASSTSFIERYAHLLDEDTAPEPIALPAPVMAHPAPLSDSNEDESIDDYIERLMMRMRGDSTLPTVERAIARGGSPTPAAPARPQAAKPQVTMPMTAEELAPPEELFTSLDDMRRSGPTPESATDMTALRALANQNARHNIGVANVRQHKEFAFVKFGISLMVVGAGAVLALMAPDLVGVQMIASCAAMLVAGFYAGRTARLLKEAVKTARVK